MAGGVVSTAQLFLAFVSALGFAVAWRAVGLAMTAREEVGALANKLTHLENEHVKLERRMFAVIPSDDALNASGGGPYRSADEELGEDDEDGGEEAPAFVVGQWVEVRFAEDTEDEVWFRAEFCGFTTADARTPLVRLKSGKAEEMYSLKSVWLRHARTP